jgi:hypothetical protein
LNQVSYGDLFTGKKQYLLCSHVSLGKPWLDLQLHADGKIKKPDELENDMQDPPHNIDPNILDRIRGSMIGLALGDALGAHVEFRPNAFLKEHPVTDLESGGTWGLQKGQVFSVYLQVLLFFQSVYIRICIFIETRVLVH